MLNTLTVKKIGNKVSTKSKVVTNLVLNENAIAQDDEFQTLVASPKVPLNAKHPVSTLPISPFLPSEKVKSDLDCTSVKMQMRLPLSSSNEKETKVEDLA